MSGLAGGVRWAAVGVALVALAGCEAPTIPLEQTPPIQPEDLPYDFRLLIPVNLGGDSVSHRTFHWPLGSTVHVLVGEEVEGRPSLAEAVEVGVGRWNRAALFGEVTLSVTTDPSQAHAVLRWDDQEPIYSSPPGCTGPSTGAALTRGCLGAGGQTLLVWPLRDQSPSRMVFRVTINRAADLDQASVTAHVTHELGHVLGILNHSLMRSDLMWGGFLESPDPSDRDLMTLRSLYQTEPDLSIERP